MVRNNWTEIVTILYPRKKYTQTLPPFVNVASTITLNLIRDNYFIPNVLIWYILIITQTIKRKAVDNYFNTKSNVIILILIRKTTTFNNHSEKYFNFRIHDFKQLNELEILWPSLLYFVFFRMIFEWVTSNFYIIALLVKNKSL